MSGNGTGQASKQGFGNQSPNVLKPPVVMVYLQLQYLAPDEDEPRNFPPQFPVTVRFGEDADPVNPSSTLDVTTYKTTKDGVLAFPARTASGKPWKKFTLKFDAVDETRPRHIYVEARGSDTKSAFTTDVPDIVKQETKTRFFSVPAKWSLARSDWKLGTNKFNGNGSFDATTGQIEHTKFGTKKRKNAPRPIGTEDAPVQLVLDPHWKFSRFEYFDRYYGPKFGNPERDGHGKRITIPPVVLEGFRDKIDPKTDDVPDTRSNWVIGENDDTLLQCLPWILRKKDDGADLDALTGTNVGLRFMTTQDADKKTWVVSESKTKRKLEHLALDSPPASPPGPDRLKAYDLPRVWKSKKYFTREEPSSPPGPGKSFNDLDQDELTKADSKDTPLVFSLDDIILTDRKLKQFKLKDEDRVAVFWHTFSDRPLLSSPPGAAIGGFSRIGVYKPGDDPHWRGYPYSDIVLSPPYQITNYPDWTRLVVAQGNLWDTFSERTPDKDDIEVVGARAAVRWTAGSPPPNYVAVGTDAGSPPAPTETKHLTIQPYMRGDFISWADNPQVAAIDHNEWTSSFATPSHPLGPGNYPIGRFDLAHVRHTDWHGEDEISVTLRYHRYAFGLAAVTASPPLAGPYPKPEDWVKEAVDTVANRWNGIDAFNPGRAWITPDPAPAQSPPSPAPAQSPPSLKSQIVTLVQYVSPPIAHHSIDAVPPTSGSWMSQRGTGEWRVNSIRHATGKPPNTDDWGGARWDPPGRGLAAAHETGHAGTMPDEYPYSKPSLCENYRFLHLPGNPYQNDYSAAHSSLMKGNINIRTRYFWHAAEWLHTLPLLDVADWKIEHGRYTDYHLPHHPEARTHPGRSFYTYPVRFNLRERSGGGAHLFDSFLYFIGKDEYAEQVLPAPVDGVLTVVVRMYFDLDVVAVGQRRGVARTLFKEVKDRFDALNRTFKANFQMSSGASPPPAFENCLLQFVPAMNVRGETDGGVNTWDWLQFRSQEHLSVEFLDNGLPLNPVDDEYNSNAPGAANEYLVEWNQGDYNALNGPGKRAWLRAVGRKIRDCALLTMGLSNNAAGAGGYNSPPSYVHVVRTVMDNAAPDPTIT